MRLTILYDHRFYRSADGVVFSIQNYNYPLFAARYLPVFDEVTILARVVARRNQERQGRHTEGPGVRVLAMGDWLGPAGFVRQRRAVRKRLRDYIPPDTAVIMLVPGILGTLAYADFAKRKRPYGVEVITDPYDVFAPQANSHPGRPFFRWWYARKLRQQCAGAAAAAYVTAAALQQRYPPHPDAFTTHYSSIELTAEAFIARPPLERVGRPKESFVLAHVGTMAQLYKAQDDLLRALHLCVTQGLDVRLILVGDGKHRAELAALAAGLGLAERVLFTGQLPAGAAVRQQLDQADLFVMPSRQEGLPRAMLEAMARGLPCIGARIGGIPELLEADNLVPVNDVAALADKIKAVLQDPARRARMAARNLEFVAQYRAELLQARRAALYTYLKGQTATWIKQQQK